MFKGNGSGGGQAAAGQVLEFGWRVITWDPEGNRKGMGHGGHSCVWPMSVKGPETIAFTQPIFFVMMDMYVFTYLFVGAPAGTPGGGVQMCKHIHRQ